MEAPASEVFVGRVRELGQLGRALDAARAGSGTAALVAGEAGIGKTRLASELAARARDAGFEVLLGRSIDLVGTELPYQPFVEALRPLGALAQVDGQAAGSQLRAFEETLALLSDRAAAAPVLLVLEDLHWADTSTLDLVVFLAHNLHDRPVLLLGTCRADEPSSAARVRRLADGVRRSGAALLLELGPLQREELTALLAAHAGTPPPAALTDAIVARSEGNPFFAEELLAAAGDQNGTLPRGLRDLLLQRVARLDPAAQGLLRLAAAAGGDVGYPLLRAAAALPEREVRESLRQAVEHGVLVAVQATGSFRFRHALLAEAVYATLLPGEREELHGRLAEELARSGAAAPAELAPHWAAAGRTKEALAASVEAARQAEAVFGLAEAHAHLERALTLWDAVADAADLVRVDLAGLCTSAAEAAWNTGAAPRAVELAQRAIELVGDGDPLRAALLHEGLGRYLHDSGRGDAAAAAPTVHVDPDVATYDAYLAELALWERRWVDADQAVRDGLARARSREMAQLRVQLCAKGLRAQAELAALARARRDADAVDDWLTRARKLLATARRAAAEAAAVTPNAAGWRALAEAEYERARGEAQPGAWSEAAATWERLERPPLAAYCRWRQAEALVAAGASRREASEPLRDAHAVAARIGARPLLRDLELLAERARLDLAPPETASPDGRESLEETLGLTPREAEVLALVARGYTNREIAATLVISVRTAGVHVSHILRKLGAPNRLEAAAIAHRLSPPHARQPASDA